MPSGIVFLLSPKNIINTSFLKFEFFVAFINKSNPFLGISKFSDPQTIIFLSKGKFKEFLDVTLLYGRHSLKSIGENIFSTLLSANNLLFLILLSCQLLVAIIEIFFG